MRDPRELVAISSPGVILCALSGVLNLSLALEYGQWYNWAAFVLAAVGPVAGMAVGSHDAWRENKAMRSQRPSQDCRPPVPVLPLPPLEPMADGLHVRVRVIDEIYVWPGLRFLLYRVELWRREEFIVTCPRDCYTEDEAQTMGEDWICRIRANKELKAAGQHEAAEMVWSS